VLTLPLVAVPAGVLELELEDELEVVGAAVEAEVENPPPDEPRDPQPTSAPAPARSATTRASTTRIFMLFSSPGADYTNGCHRSSTRLCNARVRFPHSAVGFLLGCASELRPAKLKADSGLGDLFKGKNVESDQKAGGLPGWAIALAAGTALVVLPLVAWNLGAAKPQEPPGAASSPAPAKALAVTAPPSPAPAPAASPESPATPPKASDTAALGEPPSDERVWDGHRWRKTPAGHKHGRDCGHFQDGNRWKLFASEPREYPDATEVQRARPESGLYDWGGKVWFLPDHVHGPGCHHHLRNNVWYLDD
jgi:hypothetical protein